MGSKLNDGIYIDGDVGESRWHSPELHSWLVRSPGAKDGYVTRAMGLKQGIKAQWPYLETQAPEYLIT
ncbi:hypothetical protein K7432_007380 [Basidiobolus ranarum]|uniref:Uncharacterized protein n=1 Tax=Basidiobolus ranarum TaxID=34480 RepID=A0ABR2WTK1_9FUNG